MFSISQTEAPEIEQVTDVGYELLDRASACFDRIVSGDYIGIIVAGGILAAIVVGSGALSSSIAEGRIRGREFHFFMGMLIPVAYPVLALFALPRKVYEKEEKKAMHLSKQEGSEDQAGEFDLDSSFNYDFFQRSMFDDTGNPRGPFIMSVDEVELRVERISEVLPTIVVLETVNADGKQQTMRLPFSRISSCREI